MSDIESEDFRIDENLVNGPKPQARAPRQKAIVNTLDPATGNVLCPECARGAVWKNPEDGKMYTSPMIKMHIAGRVEAMVHLSCRTKVLMKAFPFVNPPAPAAPEAGK